MSEKISIIIPAYNIEKEIKRCVESVLFQTYKSIEVIIVNDGSTDGTLEVLRNLEERDSRVHVIDKQNEGVTKARLTGVIYATGDWIGFVDGDDYIESNMYERLINNAQKYSADISHCGYQMVFPSRIDYYYNTGHFVEQDKIKGLEDLVAGNYVEPALWNKLFRKTLFYDLINTDKMDMSIKNFEDLLMNYYLFSESKLSVYEDFCPYHYIIRSNSAANSNPNKLHDWIKVTDLLLNEAKDSEVLESILRKKLVRQLISVSTMEVMGEDTELRKFRNECLKRLRDNSLRILYGKSYGYKIKIMTIGASWFPNLYGLIHRKYQKLIGVDKKYEID